MQSEILFPDNFSLVRLQLDEGELVKAEPGAMVGMSANITFEVKKSSGGIFKSLASKLLGGESFFNTHFTASGGPGEILLSPRPPGSVVRVELGRSSGYVLEKGAYLAATTGVSLDTGFQGMKKGLFSKEGFFLVHVQGEGTLWLNCFGAAHRLELAAGQRYVVDNGHLVAFSDAMEYDVKLSKGVFGSMFSGEGLVLEFVGPGEVWLQTRNGSNFGAWLMPFLPSKKGGVRFGSSDD